jgi:hypothetical protein
MNNELPGTALEELIGTWLFKKFPCLCSSADKTKIFIYSFIKLNFGNGLLYVR